MTKYYQQKFLLSSANNNKKLRNFTYNIGTCGFFKKNKPWDSLIFGLKDSLNIYYISDG